MSKFISLVVSGAVSGAVFAIMASGLVLTYEISGIFNFGHGAVAFATAFLYFQLHVGQHVPIVPAAVLSVVVFAPLFGLALDRLMLRRLAAAPVYARIVGTIGLLVALPSLALWIVEQANQHGAGLPTNNEVVNAPGLGPVPAHNWLLMKGVSLDSDQVAVFAAAALAALVLWLVLRRTRLGLQMRADVDRRDLAALRGVNTGRVSSVAWMLAMTLAGLGGVLISPFFGLNDAFFTLVVLGSMAAVVFARLRSLPLAFAGGLLLGIVQNLVAGYADSFLPSVLTRVSGLRTSVPFVLTLVGLVVLSRASGRTAGSVAREAPPPDHRAGLAPWRRMLPWAVATALLIGYTTLLADHFWAGLVAKGSAVGLIFLSFVVVTGVGGMVSLAQATFVTTGAFTAGWLLNHQFTTTTPLLMHNGRLNFALAAMVGGAAAALLGALVALPVRRLGALSLALGTLALAFLADLVVFQIDSVRHGSNGYTLPAPQIGPFHFSDPASMAVLTLMVFGLATLALRNLQHSSFGRAMYAARSSEVAARTVGLSPDRAKVGIFTVSAGIAGLGGALYAVTSGPFNNQSTPAFVGLIWLAIVVTWGVRRPGGALIAGMSFALGTPLITKAFAWNGVLKDLAGSAYFLPILFGLGAIGLARNPDGALAMQAQQKAARRAATLRRRQAGEAPGPAPAPSPLAVVSTAGGPPAAGGGAAGAEPLVFDGVRAGYGEVEVLHGVDLVLAPGSILALLGANGAGKSTLAATAAGLVTPMAGRVLHRGVDLAGHSTHQRATGGIFLAPEARGVFPGLSVQDNLALWLPDAGDRDRAYAHFPILGERRTQAAGLLSGGEQQMLALVAALIRPPDVLIADEPTLGLAPRAAAAVCETLSELRERGVSILLIEEKTAEVLELADTVALMTLGRVVWSGARAGLDADRLAAAYLGEGSLATGRT